MKLFSTIFTILLSLGSIIFLLSGDKESALLFITYAIFHKLDIKD